ncbi:MAG TPA: glycoside hydrolase family 15 protein [Xanthobacteraceae bacterium]|nr:glycoside hydrolase family 15 protein [Xanthobacteraceae bacterium]
MSAPLEHYAMIGDGETAALVCKTGSIDWLCWPRFDSDACFSALVGQERNGRWLLAPRDPDVRVTRRYRPDTLILETDFITPTGAARLTDFMPMRHGPPALVRSVTGLAGTVPMQLRLGLRFGYGLIPPWLDLEERRAIGRIGPDVTVLDAAVALARDGQDVVAEFTVREGQRLAFVLQFANADSKLPAELDVDKAEQGAESFWRDWIGQFDKPTEWPDAVRRSLIVLKALVSRSSGGIVAAPTTSLPELAGGDQNWDYRYCWLRDASFAVSALLNAGYHAEAKAWRDWILRAIAGSPEHIQIMYRMDGARDLNEWTAAWLSGYRWAAPVRIGNAAARQRQIDVYGELVEVLDLAHRAGIDREPQGLAVEEAMVRRLESLWHDSGHGIWENRGEPRRYVYSQVMAWVALERFVRSRSKMNGAGDGLVARAAATRDDIAREVCCEGFDSGLNSFVEYYGSDEIDAASLLIPAVGFLPPDDPRVTATVARVERELIQDGLVYRNERSATQGQGAFLVCNCWLADCLRMQGRHAEARRAFERLLEVRNDVGLLSEEYDLRSRRLTGNFPQALSHLGLVTTGLGLSGPVLQRGGG